MSDHTDFVPSYLLYLLAAASEGASAEFHAQVRSAGLRVPEWRVLACLHDQDGQMITRLADVALVEQSRLTHIIDQMVTRNLLKRQQDPKDKRRVRIHLTDQGRAIASDLIPKARTHEQDLMTRLAPEHAALLKPALKALLEKLPKPS